jgi:hypothetical protein
LYWNVRHRRRKRHAAVNRRLRQQPAFLKLGRNVSIFTGDAVARLLATKKQRSGKFASLTTMSDQDRLLPGVEDQNSAWNKLKRNVKARAGMITMIAVIVVIIGIIVLAVVLSRPAAAPAAAFNDGTDMPSSTITSDSCSRGEFTQLTAPAGKFSFALDQATGQLHVRNRGVPIWKFAATPQAAGTSYMAALGDDGKITVYTTLGVKVAETPTVAGAAVPIKLEMRDDSNVIVTDSKGLKLWETGITNYPASRFSSEAPGGASITQMNSTRGNSRAVFDSKTGIISVYGPAGTVVWRNRPDAGTASPYTATLQCNSALTVRAADGTVWWSSGGSVDSSNGPYSMHLYNNGILSIWNAYSRPVWYSEVRDSIGNEDIDGAVFERLTSPNKRYTFVVQYDGNGVIIDNTTGKPREWTTQQMAGGAAGGQYFATLSGATGMLMIVRPTGKSVVAAPVPGAAIVEGATVVSNTMGTDGAIAISTPTSVLWRATPAAGSKGPFRALVDDIGKLCIVNAGGLVWNSA